MRKVFCIFQGGGAQGISHIGAYRAVVSEGAEIVGVAGASAGAMIAALIAVGCQPDDILNPDKPASDPTRDILSASGLTPVKVLGEAPWKRFMRLRGMLRGLLALIFVGALLLAFAFGLPVATLVLVAFDALQAWGPVVGAVSIAVIVLIGFVFLRVLRLFRLVRGIVVDKGLFEPADVERHIEDILLACARAQLEALSDEDKRLLGDEFELIAGKRAGRSSRLKFSDIDPRRFQGLKRPPPFKDLKIATTDLTRGKLRLFGQDYHPEAAVAEVVAASISIPFLFKPARITSVPRFQGREFVDGGLLANLPVWSFKEEKRYHERRLNPHESVVNLAFELRDEEAAQAVGQPLRQGAWRRLAGPAAMRWLLFGRRQIGFMGYLSKTIRTGIFGGQAVTHSHVPDLLMIPIHSPVSLLDFDLNWQMACEAEAAGLSHALQSLLKHQRANDQIEGILREVHDETRDVIRDKGYRLADLRIRILVFVKVGVTCFKVAHSFNLGDDTDDVIQIDVDAPGVPEAFDRLGYVAFFWKGGQPSESCGWWAGNRWVPYRPQVTNSHKKEILETRESIPMSKYDVVNIWDGLQSSICFPLMEAVEGDSSDMDGPGSQTALEPLAVVCIDFNHQIADALIDDDAALARITLKASELLTLLPSSLEDH